MWKWFIPLAAGIAIAVGVAAVGSQSTNHVSVGSSTGGGQTTTPPPPPSQQAACGGMSGHPATYQHVIWIWLNDESYSDEIGNLRGAPYVNALASQCGLATGYYAVTRPGPPNAVAALSGGTQGITRNNCAPCTTSAISLLNQVGGSWGVYAQSMPGACSRATTALYSPLSNPAAFFSSANCAAHDVPLGTPTSGALASALTAGTLPRFAILVPNACTSGSVRKTPACPQKQIYAIARSDSWLQTWMRRIVASPDYQSGGTVVLITWDQGSPPSKHQAGGKLVGEACPQTRSAQCHVATLVVSPYVHPGLRVATEFTHLSLLRTSEQLLGINVYLGGAANAASMRQAFGL
ncbi:MAG TPA: alkaline phosphatase family protein [Gaiellales bacterium]|nr:alkaline phosphatase family protein [Gaiellales bacterium]